MTDSINARNQIIINLSLDSKVAEQFECMVKQLGFSARGSYVMFLHHAFHDAVKLTKEERVMLCDVGKTRTGKSIDYKEEMDTLVTLGLIQRNDAGTVQVTKKGKAAALALRLKIG